MNALKKAWMPWTAADQFPTEDAFRRFLQKRQKRFDDLRLVSLVLAAAFLIAGYVLELRPIMLLTVLPLAATLLLTVAISKIEACGS